MVSETVRVNDKPWDVRFFPAYNSDKKLAGVVGILTDASDRFTAFRLLRTLKVLSLIRKSLAQSDSTEEFLSNVCEVIQQLYAAVWIGLADRSGPKTLRIITGSNSTSRYFETKALSWDIAQKTGRNLAAEAIRTGRTQMSDDILRSPECEVWHDGAHEHGLKSLLAVPLLRDGASLGVLVVHNNDPVVIDKEEISLWEKIVTEVTEGISLLEERQERKRMLLERQEVDDKYKQLVETVFDVCKHHLVLVRKPLIKCSSSNLI